MRARMERCKRQCSHGKMGMACGPLSVLWPGKPSTNRGQMRTTERVVGACAAHKEVVVYRISAIIAMARASGSPDRMSKVIDSMPCSRWLERCDSCCLATDYWRTCLPADNREFERLSNGCAGSDPNAPCEHHSRAKHTASIAPAIESRAH